jgi:hypothetical protein
MAEYFEREISSTWDCLELDCYPVAFLRANVRSVTSINFWAMTRFCSIDTSRE